MIMGRNDSLFLAERQRGAEICTVENSVRRLSGNRAAQPGKNLSAGFPFPPRYTDMCYIILLSDHTSVSYEPELREGSRIGFCLLSL